MTGAGIGLRGPHIAEIMAERPAVGFLEVHAENYMGETPAAAALEELRRDYPISLHSVGLSLGSAGSLSFAHLTCLRALVERLEPTLVSEHLAWCEAGGVYFNDLLPLPYTEEALDLFCSHVDQAQDNLRCQLLVENPASYLRFRHSTMGEAEFLNSVVQRTGCGVLCDVNNLYVNSENFGFDPISYLDALPARAVAEIHVAGHHHSNAAGAPILIDDHGAQVAEPVWSLYLEAIERFGGVPTLVEWDTRIPPLGVLLGEARRADAIANARA
jgi:uncharacterized protein (UPF0276 family)